ncbi:MAG: hypothetical protein AAGA32_21275 [Pseudomonadota bacterium]
MIRAVFLLAVALLSISGAAARTVCGEDVVAAGEIEKHFDRNPISAEGKYLGKNWNVYGYISKISSESTLYYFLYLGEDFQVRLEKTDQNRQALDRVSRGQKVFVCGRVEKISVLGLFNTGTFQLRDAWMLAVERRGQVERLY